MVGVLHSAVPFAESRRSVARLFEGIGQRGFVQIETLPAFGGTAYSHSRVVAPREQFGAGRRAHGLHVEAVE